MKNIYSKIVRALKIKKKNMTPDGILIENIENALIDIFSARKNFDMAVGDDNIELAIYQLSTAEIKYQNLIKEAKRLGIIRCDVPGKEVEEN